MHIAVPALGVGSGIEVGFDIQGTAFWTAVRLRTHRMHGLHVLSCVASTFTFHSRLADHSQAVWHHPTKKGSKAGVRHRQPCT